MGQFLRSPQWRSRKTLNLISFSGDAAAIEAARWNDFNERLERALDIREDIYVIENQEIGQINYAMERLRLRERRLELDQELTPEALAEIDSDTG